MVKTLFQHQHRIKPDSYINPPYGKKHNNY